MLNLYLQDLKNTDLFHNIYFFFKENTHFKQLIALVEYKGIDRNGCIRSMAITVCPLMDVFPFSI